MHNQLETYLADVAGHLSLIPAKERAEELREMRAHLEQIAAQHRERGLSEDDAVALTLARFGEAEAVSQDLVTAWQRGEAIKNKRSLWSAAACAVVLNVVIGFVSALFTRAIAARLWRPANEDHFHMVCLIICIMGLNVISRVVTGGFSGFLFPRRAVAGVAIGMAGWVIYDTVRFVIIQRAARIPHAVLTPSNLALIIGINIGSILILSLGATILSAWVGSRWRMRRELALAR